MCVLDFCRGAINNKALHKITGGYKELFPVQAAAWRETAGGCSAAHDLCICAPTGSGKTLAYALPIVAALSGCALPPKHAQTPACRVCLVVRSLRHCCNSAGQHYGGRCLGSRLGRLLLTLDRRLCKQNMRRLSLRLTFIIILTGG